MKMQCGYISPQISTSFSEDLDDLLCDIEFVKKSQKLKYANIPCVFDIETSSFYKDDEKQATMYAWVFGMNGKCVRGRTWREFLDTLDRVIQRYDINLEKRLIVYVHNLAYEFQWFNKYFSWDKVFSTDTRKPLYALTTSGIEFRCSYLLSGYSLAVLGNNLTKYKVEKKVGDLDYKLIRHSRTPLSEKEWGYILNDGLVVMAHIQEEIERLGDITKLPLTKTGYVRNLCRERCFKGEDKFNFVRQIKKCQMTADDYLQLKRAYMGGFTHANINYVDRIIENVSSYDFTSSYPTVMVSEKFPMGEAIRRVLHSEQEFISYLQSYCCLFDVTFTNIRSKVNYENYISASRCNNIEHFYLNNGRVIEADTLSITLTEQDFFIIAKMYEWDYIDISNFKTFYKAYLPKDLVLTILELYKNKTELKGVAEKIVEYLVSKGMINAVYGMSVTDPCKDENIFDGQWSVVKANIDELIEKYNKSPQRFLFYAWGVWVTAYSRRNLFTGIFEFKNDYLYSDTDSLKVIHAEKHKNYIEEYNRKVTDKIFACLDYYGIDRNMAHPKTIKGKVKPLGVWDFEHTYTRFKTLGAKRYMTELDGEIEITIAGVSKKNGVEFLKWKYKTNDNIFKEFTENLVFPSSYICKDKNGKDTEKNGSGKMTHTYIDNVMEGEIIDYMGNKWIYHEESGIHLENTEYSLTYEADFKALILGIKGAHMV